MTALPRGAKVGFVIHEHGPELGEVVSGRDPHSVTVSSKEKQHFKTTTYRGGWSKEVRMRIH